MEIDFRTSDALSRAHFAIVQQVENASSPQGVDAMIRNEISTIRAKLQDPNTSSHKAAECLILLQYCQSMAPYSIKSRITFALAHAVKLTEGGESLSDRQIAYQYCTQNLPPNHELHLMLINTVRKDLYSQSKSRIAVALNFVAQTPSTDIIPAIQERLHELLSHKSLDLRRRTLFAIRALASLDPTLSRSLETSIMRQAGGAYPALSVIAIDILATHSTERHQLVIVDLILKHLNNRDEHFSRATITLLNALIDALKPNNGDNILDRVINSLISLLTRLRPQKCLDGAILLAIFTVLAQLPVETVLSRVTLTPSASPLVYLRPLLAGTNASPNARCLAMRCLLYLSPKLWTGISARPENTDATKKALTIEEHEVANIMSFLESDDPTLRALTYKVLSSVDPAILQEYRDRLISSLAAPPKLPRSPASSATASTKEMAPTESDQKILRIMEVLEVLATNGTRYASGVGQLLSLAETSYTSPPGSPTHSGSKGRGQCIHEVVVEKTLSYLDTASAENQGLFIQQFLEGPSTIGETLFDVETPNPSVNREAFFASTKYGPTGLTILAAAACAYAGLANTPCETIILQLNEHLDSAPIAVQEPLLLAMLRISAMCPGGLPDEVTRNVEALCLASGRHIKSRCRQFLELSKEPDRLKQVVDDTYSASLPHFLMALEASRAQPHKSRPSPPPFATSPPSSPPMLMSKLRYDVYEPPKPTLPRSAYRKRSGSTSVSVASSPRSARLDDKYDDEELSKTVTAGELALAGTTFNWLQSENRTRRPPPSPQRSSKPQEDNVIEKFELISLDSPFRSESKQLSESTPSDSVLGASRTAQPRRQEFESIWARFADPRGTARGWSSSPLSSISVILHEALPHYKFVIAPDSPSPFIEDASSPTAETCALIREGTNDVAALRLKPAEDSSCMWTLRCIDAETRVAIKEALD